MTMTVRYVRVNPVADLFAPAVRANGNVGIVGKVTPPNPVPPDLLAVGEFAAFTDPAEARRRAPGDLGEAVALAFTQSPGPMLVIGVRVDDAAPDWEAALDLLATQDVQIVALAGEPLDAVSGAADGSVRTLADHVASVSSTGGDGMERIGVAMLEKDATDPTIVSGALASERMVYVAHRSDEDVAAAVAGTIAGYEPHVSLLFKPVAVSSAPFTSAQIGELNGSETFTSGPAGKGVNWLVDPPLIPGQAVFLGEGYTGNPGGKKYVDVVRTIDSVTFLLKARLIRTIGNVRISRSGLRGLGATIESVLEPLIRQGVIEAYTIVIPVLNLLDKAQRSPAEDQQINNAQSERVVEVLVAVDYAGAIHRIALTLKFE
jgi:hypothetical protein